MSDITYNRESTIAAWQHYIDTGEILENKIRKCVADSWVRCQKSGIDPFSTNYPKTSRRVLISTQDKYAKLMSYAVPCLHLLMTILVDGGVTLTSPELFTYYMISSYEKNPSSYGIFLDEATCGNTAISIAHHEKKPIFLHKYEKFRLVDQNVSSAAAPIFSNGEISGFISANSLLGLSPKYIYDLTCKTADIIGRLYSSQNDDKEALRCLIELLELSHRPIMLIDKDGCISAGNSDCRRFLQIKQPDGSPAHLSDILVNKDDISCFLIDGDQDRRLCNLRTIYGNTFNCTCMKKGSILLPGGMRFTAVSLEISTPGRQAEASRTPIIQAVVEREQNVEYTGNSLAWSRIDHVIKKISKFPSNVFLQGESGTGKEVVARTIHNLSGRQGKFVAINCGDIPDGLLQSELFGYEKGAFTGANRDGNIGKLEYADNGTVFLDEIGDMPLSMQVSLLRFIQERTIQRVGSTKLKSVDVRIIAATNKNVEQMLKDQTFRSDLYYRLNIIGLTLPPLRERKEDIPVLAQHFFQTISKQYGIPEPKVDEDVYKILCHYDWPGNVRELRNAVEKMLIMSEHHHVDASTVYTYIFDYDDLNGRIGNAPLSEKEKIISLLEQNNGNVSLTAAALGITRDTLYRRMKKYDIISRKK